MKKSLYILVFLTLIPFISRGQDTQTELPNVYGGIGLIETPTARFSKDGDFTFGVAANSPNNKIYSKVQFFPWMQAVLRYTEGTFKPYFDGSQQTWKDKGIDLKFKIFNESELIPQIAFGIRDLAGTGRYASEYIVASKEFNYADVTVGLGWGKLNGKEDVSNPLKWITSSQRGGTQGGFGGSLNLGNYFSGDSASLFGGIQIYTPFPHLSLILEYDSSDYSNLIGVEENFFKTGNLFELDTRFNYSINYQIEPTNREKVNLSLGMVRGNTFFANISVSSNLNKLPIPKYIAPPERLKSPYLEPFEELSVDWQKYLSELIMWQMGNEGIVTHTVIFNKNELQAEISQGRFQRPIQAIDLASRILANNSPKNITDITVINLDQGLETFRSTIKRNELVDIIAKRHLDEVDVLFTSKESILDESIIVNNEYLYPNLYWNLKPKLGGTIQHQEKFFFYQLEALFHATYSINRSLLISTDIGINVDNNFEEYTYHIPDGDLHHVRQDRRLYLTEGLSGIRRLVVDYTKDLTPNIKARLTGGYFESMFGGIGGEILYMPDSKSWGLSLDSYWLKQRDFNQKFGFQNYETISGFLNLFYDLPIYDTRLKISAGKFLGKDKGAHIELSRRFETGARIGGSVSLTDCDAGCVGEGSFNKWIFFELPMDLFYTKSTVRHKTGYSWSPLTKDAGTKVNNGDLFSLMTNAKDEIEIYQKRPWSLKKILSGFSVSAPNNN